MFEKRQINTEQIYIWLSTIFLCSLLFGYAMSSISFVLLVLFGVVNGVRKRKVYKNIFYVFPVVYFFIGLFSLFWTNNETKTVESLSRHLPFLLFPLSFYFIPYYTKRIYVRIIKNFAYFLALFFIFLLINSLIRYLDSREVGEFFYHSLVSPFKDNAIYVSSFVMFTFLFGVEYFFSRKDKIILSILFLFLLFLSSKNIIITTLLILFLIASLRIVRQKELKKVFFLIPLLVIVGMSIYFLIPIRERFMSELTLNLDFILYGKDYYDYQWTGFQNRIFQNRIFFEMIADDNLPFYGLGLGASQDLLTGYYKHYNMYEDFWDYNFHNQYLQTYSEVGIVGLGIVFTMLFSSLYLFIKKSEYVYLIFFILFFILFFTESFLVRQKGIMFFCFIYCTIGRFSHTNYK
ncbi:MAG: O-antigen ligase family protein [Flavobacteriales bacterium]|nr:O-antigen ligase family protein [Flavobacteriales bacterium]